MAKEEQDIPADRERLFLHKGFALMQLKNAVLSLQAIEQVCAKCAAQTTVVAALMRDAVVQYGSIFKLSELGERQSHKCDSSIVPKQFSELHGQLITYRDKLFAHVDFELRNPVKIESQEAVSWHMDNKGPHDLVKKLPEIKALIIQIMQRLGLEVVQEHKELSQEH